jgi:hypothetical protein
VTVPIITRRELLARIGGHFIGAHAASLAAPVIDFLGNAPNRNVNAALQGLRYGYGQALTMLLQEGPRPGWPYLHCLCHCYAVASMNAPDEDRIAWSRFGGRQDELMQVYWAQFYRGTIHPFIVENLLRTNDTLKEAESEYDTAMKFVWGDEAERAKASVKCRLARGRNRFQQLADLRHQLHPLIDACESAWQRSDERDNALGLKGGLACPRRLDDQTRLAWCRRWCEDHDIRPDTPEGPGTDREWGPFHPLHPGPPWDSEPHEEPLALAEISSYDVDDQAAAPRETGNGAK